MSTIINRINAGEFTCSQLHPGTFYADRETMNDQQIRKAKEAHFEKLREYRRAVDEATARFREVVEQEYGMTNHPKASLLWTRAWEEGHANGYTEVLVCYDDLFSFLQEFGFHK